VRILLASSHGADLSYGGAERYVADLVRGLRGREHEVNVISAFPVANDPLARLTLTLHGTDWRRDPLRRLRNHAGDVISIPGRRLREAVESADPDVLHTSNLPGVTTAIWEIGRRLRIPVVHTLHDYYLLCPRVTLERPDGRPCRPHPLLCGLRTRRLARWADGVAELIAGSEHLLRVHDGLFPACGSHVIRLPLVRSTDRPLTPPRAPLRTLGYLGALERSKGIENLLAAAPAIADLGVILRVAGDGRLRPAVEAATGPCVQYAGRVTGAEKLAFLESVDLAVLPSLWAEPSGPPYALLEWLAAGRPVLASARGGLGEAQAMPGVVVVEPKPIEIVDGVRRLLDEETWRNTLAGLPRIEDDRDVERWLDEHESVYREALK
jgi:glycosyltransferase involved in cell wall biosynthesis